MLVADYTQGKSVTGGLICRPKALMQGIIRSGSTQAHIVVASFMCITNGGKRELVRHTAISEGEFA